MKWIKAFFILFYRMWFYILVAVPIIVLFPLLLVSTSREKFYPFFFKLARIWAKIVLYGMGFYPVVKRLAHLQPEKSYMLVANHTSMADIMLMLAIVKKPFVFVGKKELAKFPVFGFFYKRTCILVDRKNTKSRQDVFYSAQRRLKQGNSICIFPEGGVPDDLSIVVDSFKDGAFRLAIEHKIPVVPMVFYDNKKRFSYSFFKCSPGKMRVKVLNFLETEHLEQKDKRALREKTRNLILETLEKKRFLVRTTA